MLIGCGGSQNELADADAETGIVAGLLMTPVTEAQAVRFLHKSSFGATASSVEQLRRLGYAKYVDEQIGIRSGLYNTYMIEGYGGYDNVASYCAKFTNEISDVCRNWNIFTQRPTSVLFFRSAVNDDDQLRLRVAARHCSMVWVSQLVCLPDKSWTW